MTLYFIALIPPLKLRERIKALKEEMRDRFDAKHALKSPAHITLQMPIKQDKNLEPHMEESLQRFAQTQKPFSVALSGFDHFEHRVIFVRVANHEPVLELHQRLLPVLREELKIKEHELSTKIHPHMTIATRDLKRYAFLEAWPAFETRAFEDSFMVEGIFLLKHNGKHWEVYREFPF